MERELLLILKVYTTLVLLLYLFSNNILTLLLTLGCSLKIRDPSCWFDSNNVSNEFTLHLSDPYERAICLELLRLVTHQDEYEIQYYNYKESLDDASGVELKFVTTTVMETTLQINKTGKLYL